MTSTAFRRGLTGLGLCVLFWAGCAAVLIGIAFALSGCEIGHQEQEPTKPRSADMDLVAICQWGSIYRDPRTGRDWYVEVLAPYQQHLIARGVEPVSICKAVLG